MLLFPPINRTHFSLVYMEESRLTEWGRAALSPVNWTEGRVWAAALDSCLFDIVTHPATYFWVCSERWRGDVVMRGRTLASRDSKLPVSWNSSDHVLSFPELKGLGADFTFGFIQVMDGEKDPRNLLVAFRIVHDLISRDYSLGMSWQLWIRWLGSVRWMKMIS